MAWFGFEAASPRVCYCRGKITCTSTAAGPPRLQLGRRISAGLASEFGKDLIGVSLIELRLHTELHRRLHISDAIVSGNAVTIATIHVAHLMISIKASEATTCTVLDRCTADCEVGPQTSTADSSESHSLGDKGLRQKKRSCSASLQHEVNQRTEPVHEGGQRELVWGADDLRHYQWKQKESANVEGHQCHPASAN